MHSNIAKENTYAYPATIGRVFTHVLQPPRDRFDNLCETAIPMVLPQNSAPTRVFCYINISAHTAPETL